jgi:hypothetical protein
MCEGPAFDKIYNLLIPCHTGSKDYIPWPHRIDQRRLYHSLSECLLGANFEERQGRADEREEEEMKRAILAYVFRKSSGG